ncbi:MAG TPA: TlpA disulfide reductase family protein [Burkholderiaceae bacterium]|jgi:thiol-disulfide isomerase/thioredoxin|nr:TlpA disulfide reductase family protein [Burkholderiaceae bacterium]
MKNGIELESPPRRRRARPRRDALGGLLAALGWALSPTVVAEGSPQGVVPIGQPLRDGPLTGLNGPSRRLSDFRGHPLIINVWASWCGPCRQEMASLERLAWRGDARSFDIVGISTDDDPAAARRLLASTNATIAHFIDQRLFWETMLGASQLPLTVLVDAHGRVLDRVYGAQQWDGPAARGLISRTFGHGAR